MIYCHVDVFSSKSLSGNGLTVVFHKDDLHSDYMQALAVEFKQFETIFLQQTGDTDFRARIFTVEEDLDFAGHPVLGAAASVHDHLYAQEKNIVLTFALNNKTVQVKSSREKRYFQTEMNQGIPQFMGTIDDKKTVHAFLHALHLTADDLYPGLPMEVVSTGLPYLLIPLSSGLEKAYIAVKDLEAQLNRIHADFVYIFDVNRMEGRTWNNSGTLEDVATGSAAGPVGAYVRKWGIRKTIDPVIINQGRFLGRPSKIKVRISPSTGEVYVAGDVTVLARGRISADSADDC